MVALRKPKLDRRRGSQRFNAQGIIQVLRLPRLLYVTGLNRRFRTDANRSWPCDAVLRAHARCFVTPYGVRRPPCLEGVVEHVLFSWPPPGLLS